MADSTVTIVGNVTRDPEMRYTPSGVAKASFGVAVSRRWQNRTSHEWEEQTSFFNVVCWREMAENVCESIGKGARVVRRQRTEMDRRQQRAGRVRPPRIVQRIALAARRHDQESGMMCHCGCQLGQVRKCRPVGPVQVFDD